LRSLRSRSRSLSSLTELRVLNLAGNEIRTVECVGSLQSLTELNLRRNKINHVYELHLLPALQRVFLSNNALIKFEDLACVFKVKFLLELALDGNPVVTNVEQAHVAAGDVVIKGEDGGIPASPNAPSNLLEAGGIKSGSIVVAASSLYRAYVPSDPPHIIIYFSAPSYPAPDPDPRALAAT